MQTSRQSMGNAELDSGNLPVIAHIHDPTHLSGLEGSPVAQPSAAALPWDLGEMQELASPGGEGADQQSVLFLVVK